MLSSENVNRVKFML